MTSSARSASALHRVADALSAPAGASVSKRKQSSSRTSRARCELKLSSDSSSTNSITRRITSKIAPTGLLDTIDRSSNRLIATMASCVRRSMQQHLERFSHRRQSSGLVATALSKAFFAMAAWPLRSRHAAKLAHASPQSGSCWTHREKALAAFPSCAFSSLTSARRMRQHPRSNQLCDACGRILTVSSYHAHASLHLPLFMCLLAKLRAARQSRHSLFVQARSWRVASSRKSPNAHNNRGWSGFCSSSLFSTSNASSRLPAAAYNSMTKSHS
mmetsp:Transcript_3378/g.9679  ORF Transcript_3378/g.9679 Transcript_3378/m.9679 type:complete len:273 (-) Transcript_3378:1594-2412(-)